MARRDFVRANYTGSGTKGKSAARLARYIEFREQGQEREFSGEDRELEREEPERTRYERVQTFGDRDTFVEAAKERAEAGKRSSYVHVVISPERGGEYTDRDLERLVEPWTRDRNGNELSYFGAIHRDTEHPHVHVAVARDKFQKAEYARLKEESRGIMGERERMLVPEREPELERILERESELERERERSRELEREREEPEREREATRDRGLSREQKDRGMEWEGPELEL
jgi:hypothetical protein